jgi:hypothetical protein
MRTGAAARGQMALYIGSLDKGHSRSRRSVDWRGRCSSGAGPGAEGERETCYSRGYAGKSGRAGESLEFGGRDAAVSLSLDFAFNGENEDAAENGNRDAFKAGDKANQNGVIRLLRRRFGDFEEG